MEALPPASPRSIFYEPPRRKIAGWSLVLLASVLVIWVQLQLNGPGLDSGIATALEQHVGKLMLAHDENATTGYAGPAWLRWWLELDAIPEDVHDVFASVLPSLADEPSSSSSPGSDTFGSSYEATLAIEYALICRRFELAPGQDPALWQARRERAWKQVPDFGRDAVFGKLALAVFAPDPKGDSAQLKQTWDEYQAESGANWWTFFISAQLDLDRSNLAPLEQLYRQDALADAEMTGYIFGALTILGLLGMPFVVRSLIKPSPLTPSQQRLFRLWEPRRVLGIYAWVTLAGIALTIAIPFVVQLIAGASLTWNGTIAVWLVAATLGVALPVLALVRWLGPSPSRLIKTLGLTWGDFFQPKYLAYFALGIGIIPWLDWGTSAAMEALGVPPDATDGLSRSMAELGSLSLPLTIFWGTILAPVVEEFIFRGFIFRAIQVRIGTWPAMLISSALFAAGHLYSLNGTVHVFVAGMLLAWVYHRTGKLAAAMLLHGASNLFIALMSHFLGA